jgi:hypothetical protein
MIVHGVLILAQLQVVKGREGHVALGVWGALAELAREAAANIATRLLT